jgi:hypothetical protein
LVVPNRSLVFTSRAAAICIGSKLTAPVAADPARRLRRVGEEDIAVMVNLLIC